MPDEPLLPSHFRLSSPTPPLSWTVHQGNLQRCINRSECTSNNEQDKQELGGNIGMRVHNAEPKRRRRPIPGNNSPWGHKYADQSRALWVKGRDSRQ